MTVDDLNVSPQTTTFGIDLPMPTSAEIFDAADDNQTGPECVVADALFDGQFIGRGPRPKFELVTALTNIGQRIKHFGGMPDSERLSSRLAKVKEQVDQLPPDVEQIVPKPEPTERGLQTATHAAFLISLPLSIARIVFDEANEAHTIPGSIVERALYDGRYVGTGVSPAQEIESALTHAKSNAAMVDLRRRFADANDKLREARQEAQRVSHAIKEREGKETKPMPTTEPAPRIRTWAAMGPAERAAWVTEILSLPGGQAVLLYRSDRSLLPRTFNRKERAILRKRVIPVIGKRPPLGDDRGEELAGVLHEVEKSKRHPRSGLLRTL